MKDRNELIADARAMIANLRDAQRSALTQAFGEFRQGLHCDYILQGALAYEWHIGQIRHFLDRADLDEKRAALALHVNPNSYP